MPLVKNRRKLLSNKDILEVVRREPFKKRAQGKYMESKFLKNEEQRKKKDYNYLYNSNCGISEPGYHCFNYCKEFIRFFFYSFMVEEAA